MTRAIKIKPVSGSIDSSLLVLILAIITLVNFFVAAYKSYYTVDTTAYILWVVFLGMLIWTSYCAAYLIRFIYITDSKFILRRPYARFWIKKLKTDLLHINLTDIATISILKEDNYEGAPQGQWKIILRNRS